MASIRFRHLRESTSPLLFLPPFSTPPFLPFGRVFPGAKAVPVSSPLPAPGGPLVSLLRGLGESSSSKTGLGNARPPTHFGEFQFKISAFSEANLSVSGWSLLEKVHGIANSKCIIQFFKGTKLLASTPTRTLGRDESPVPNVLTPVS